MIENYRKQYIPLNLRKAVIDRDGKRCVFCDEDLTDKEIHLDHIIPEAKGGHTTMQNLQVTCRKCNTSKGTLTEAEFIHKLRQRAINILHRLGPEKTAY